MDFTEEVFLWSVTDAAAIFLPGCRALAGVLTKKSQFIKGPNIDISSVPFRTSSLPAQPGAVNSGEPAVLARSRVPSTFGARVAAGGPADSAEAVAGTTKVGGTKVPISRQKLATSEKKLSCHETEPEQLDWSVGLAATRRQDASLNESLGRSQEFGGGRIMKLGFGLCGFTSLSVGVSYLVWRYVSRGRREGQSMWGEWKKQSRLEKIVARAILLANRVYLAGRVSRYKDLLEEKRESKDSADEIRDSRRMNSESLRRRATCTQAVVILNEYGFQNLV
ncbi:hypothetical protein KFL_000820020 [Klebsormidium nitens]|uniref:Uncharacterized protein n=1 Tax=Klebsormidium nitens TaxID=105231 RepID=A0A1Y1HY93_KLENI|nr:hypothetical protein KFL_000820020 [Klebsormidium nitens]|eukprot:GAQ81496.1 hypothetical protein KFL_000820020 [Klebsormidium nitens]